MKFCRFPTIRCTGAIALAAWIGFLPQLGAAELPQVDVQCGVVYSVFTRPNAGPSLTAASGKMGGSDWASLLYLAYAPFVTVKNNTGWPLVLNKGGTLASNVTFDQPKLGLRFKRVGDSHAGFVTTQPAALETMYVAATGANKTFGMTLVGAGSPQPGLVTLQPGEMQVFTPLIPSSAGFDDVLDWQNNLTSALQAKPGWNGPGNGYCVDWLTGQASIDPAVNSNLVVVPTRLQDSWEVEIQPTAALNGCRVFRYPSNPSSTWPMNPEPDLQVGQFPFSSAGSQSALMSVTMTQPVSTWQVRPIFSVLLPPTSKSGFVTDQNHNGMNDEWEKHFFNGGAAIATADKDGDGFSNLFEFLAGTSPVDASDFIRQSLVSQSDGGMLYQWSSLENRSYVVETSTDLATWIPSGTITATSTISSYPLAKSESGQRFVRVRIIPPQQTGL